MMEILAVVSAASLINLLIYIVILGLIVWLVLYIINALPLPEPFGTVARVLIMVIAVIIVILLLLQLVGLGPGIAP